MQYARDRTSYREQFFTYIVALEDPGQHDSRRQQKRVTCQAQTCDFPCPRPEDGNPRAFHWELRFTTARRRTAGRKRGGITNERAIGRGGKNRGGVYVLPIVRDHSGEHVGIDREQVDTFREEIARRTDTSRARSSYPQHPAVVVAATAAAAAAATVEGDEAEHARNSAPPSTPIRPFFFPPMGYSHPFAHPPPLLLVALIHRDSPLLGQPLPLPLALHALRFVPNSRQRPRNLTLPFTALYWHLYKSLRPENYQLGDITFFPCRITVILIKYILMCISIIKSNFS